MADQQKPDLCLSYVIWETFYLSWRVFQLLEVEVYCSIYLRPAKFERVFHKFHQKSASRHIELIPLHTQALHKKSVTRRPQIGGARRAAVPVNAKIAAHVL